MGNTIANKLSQFSCKSSCVIDSENEKEIKEHRKYLKSLSLTELIKIKEMIEERKNDMLRISTISHITLL